MQAFVASGLVVALAVAACKARTDASGVRSDQGADGIQPFDAEDLAILLPLDHQTLKRPFASLSQLTDLLDDSALIPLARVMSFAFYRDQLLPALTSPAAGELNPFAADEAQKAWTDAPETQWKSWYVTAIRFVPCGIPDFPVPTAWTRSVANEPAHLGCRPRIRLSVQKFGVADCPVSCVVQQGEGVGSQQHWGTSDDKAFHLVFSFAGDPADGSWQKIAAADAAAAAALAALKQQNALTRDKAEAAIRQAYEPAKDALTGLRRTFLQRVDGLRDATASGALRLAFGAPAALPKLKHYVTTTLSEETVFESLTQSMTVTDRARLGDGEPDPKYPGPKPGFAQRWFFAKYLPTKALAERRRYLGTAQAPRGTLLDRIPLNFAFETAGRTVGAVTSGEIEVFDDAPGSLLALDKNLQESLLALPQDERDPAFLSTGLQDYAFFRKLDGELGFENAQFLVGRVSEVDIAAATREGYQRVNDPSLHESGDPGCASCHVVTGVAVRRDREAAASNQPDRRIGRVANAVAGGGGQTNFSIEPAQLGPGSTGGDLGQARVLGETWIVRAFGYYGWSPVIADRVVAEVKDDVAFANQALQGL